MPAGQVFVTKARYVYGYIQKYLGLQFAVRRARRARSPSYRRSTYYVRMTTDLPRLKPGWQLA
jgi:hypothetical protein